MTTSSVQTSVCSLQILLYPKTATSSAETDGVTSMKSYIAELLKTTGYLTQKHANKPLTLTLHGEEANKNPSTPLN